MHFLFKLRQFSIIWKGKSVFIKPYQIYKSVKHVQVGSFSLFQIRRSVKCKCDETLSQTELLGRSSIAVFLKVNIRAATWKAYKLQRQASIKDIKIGSFLSGATLLMWVTKMQVKMLLKENSLVLSVITGLALSSSLALGLELRTCYL